MKFGNSKQLPYFYFDLILLGYLAVSFFHLAEFLLFPFIMFLVCFGLFFMARNKFSSYGLSAFLFFFLLYYTDAKILFDWLKNGVGLSTMFSMFVGLGIIGVGTVALGRILLMFSSYEK